MKIKIFSLENAMNYQPDNPTYAVRIDGVRWRIDYSRWKLRESKLYTIKEYAFDDIFPDEKEPRLKLFDQNLALEILKDFEQEGISKDTLLVHCLQGKNRSPAVGIALNEIYNLGYDTEKLKEQFPESNWFVYRTLIATAKIH